MRTAQICTIGFVLLAVAACQAQGGSVLHRVPKVNSELAVDGYLDEHLWDEALTLDLNYEVLPGENVPPPVETEILLAYDDTHLYCGFRAYDPDPSKICARMCDRDNLWSDDWVALNLDTFNDQRRSFLFFCNPLGVQGDNIEVNLTFSSIHSEERDEIDEDFGRRDSNHEFGVTARWGLTPNLTLNGTINPDFSQVEADAAQLDINTQFALHYPERRPFFLEAADLFRSGLEIIHTRTLADPVWGIKLTGKETAENAIGAFMVLDEVTNLLLPGSEGSETTNLGTKTIGSVLRSRRDVGSSSTLGMMFTDREGSDYYNRVGGLDCDMRLTEKELLRLQILGSQTRYPDTVSVEFGQPEGQFEDVAFDFFYIHQTSGLDWYTILRDVGSHFRADLGYRPKVGYRFAEAGWGHTWHNDSDHWYNMLNVGSGYEYEEEESGSLLYQGFASWFDFEGQARSFVHLWGFYGRKKYDGAEFHNRIFSAEGGLWPTGSLYVQVCGRYGDEVDYDHKRQGRQLTLSPCLEYRLGRHLSFEIGHTFQHLRVDEGRLYTADVSRLKTMYQFSKRVFLRLILQYVGYDRNTDLYEDPDTEPKETYLASQVLFSYKVNPRTVVFIGYNDTYYGDEDVDLTRSGRTLFAKIGYACTL